jgi:hypothetical protein
MYGFPNARVFCILRFFLRKFCPQIIALYIAKSIKSRLSQPQLASECKNLQQIKNWTLLCSYEELGIILLGKNIGKEKR